MYLDQFSKRMSTLNTRLQGNLSSTLYEDSQEILKELKDRSPVDTGAFRSSWYLSRVGKSRGITSLKIRNTSTYGMYLDEGAAKGGPPWFFPSGTASDGAKSSSGKLVLANGRVWAGGLSPSGFVVGGIISPVIENNFRRQMVLANKLLDTVVQTI